MWNKARNCYVVASEFAKNHQTGSSRIKAASVAAVMAAAMLTAAGADIVYASSSGGNEQIKFTSTTNEKTGLKNPDLEHINPLLGDQNKHTDTCGERIDNTTLKIGDINKVTDDLVYNDDLLYKQGIKNVTMEDGTISLIRNDGNSVQNNITLTGNGGVKGKDTSVTVEVGNQSQTFKTGSVVTAKKDANGNATELTINGNSYGIKAGKHTTLVDGENTKATLVKDDATGTQYKVDVDLSEYAKTEDVAVVYNKNKTSLRSTNASVKDNSIALGKGASAVENSVAIGNGASVVDGSNGVSGVALGNKAHAGYKGTSLGSNAISGREGTTLVGANTNSGSLYTTVVGTDSVINSDGTAYKVSFMGIKKELNVQGATATVVGSKNTVDNKNGKVYSGVANNVMGSANTVEGSNGVTIQGTGNKVTDAYKDMNIGAFEAYNIGKGDYSALAKKKSGAVAVIGGANTVSKQTDSTVIGYDNKLTGDNEKGSHDVFMAGSHNELTNVSDSIVMGNKNVINGVSNVISFGHQNTISADNAVAIGNGADVSVEGGVALGVGSVASTAAGALGYGAAEGETGIAWKATNGAVSVGSSVEGKKITRQITNVAAGTADTDAVNVAQLKTAKTEVKAGTNITSVDKTTGANGQDIYTINAKDTTYAAGNGIAINGENNAISVKLKEGENNLEVTADGLALKKDLTVNSVNAGKFFMDNTKGVGYGDKAYITKDGLNANDKVITNVAKGVYNTDAVNVGQLKEVGEVAANANKGWNLSTNGVATEATNVKPGDYVDFSGDQNVSISKDAKGGVNTVKVELNKDLTGIETISNDGASLTLNGTATELTNGKGAAITLFGDTTTINNKVTVYKDGRIAGVAAGINDKDAVNVGQLNAVGATANKGWNLATNGVATEATNVKPGDFVDFSGDKNISVSHDGTKVKVNLNKDIMLGDLTGKYVSISGTNGTIETTGYIATQDRVYADKGAKLADIDVTGDKISNGASSIVLDGSNVKVNDKVTIDQDGKISGVAAGEISSTSTDAINGSQLHQTNENVAALDKRVTQNEADIAQNKADIAQNKADIAQNKADIAQNKADIAANRTDIDKNAADIAQNKTDIKNLGNRVTNVEELAKKHTTVTQGDNIAVTESTNKDGGKEYKVALNKDINLDSVTTGQTVMNNDGLKVGKDVSVTATAVIAGKTSISDEGVKVGDKTYISDKGLNANDQKVTNVAAGELSATSKDAVNGSQLYETNQAIANNATNISSLSHSISNLDNRVNKVGAGAAALAALHPLDFDPDAKWDFAAGYGNYRGANAAAVGAYYRPNEDTMFSVGGTFGNGENMVNAGVSFKLGSGSSHVSTSRVAMAKEIKELRGELEAMKSAMLDANAGKKIDTSKLQLFPDVPQNHWAYEYVAQLAGNGMIEGYPDGNFAGDRPMTRYEFAAILYRAMTKGAVLSDKLLSEFSHELEYFTVDTIAKDKAGNPTIQRVRTVKENKNK